MDASGLSVSEATLRAGGASQRTLSLRKRWTLRERQSWGGARFSDLMTRGVGHSACPGTVVGGQRRACRRCFRYHSAIANSTKPEALTNTSSPNRPITHDRAEFSPRPRTGIARRTSVLHAGKVPDRRGGAQHKLQISHVDHADPPVVEVCPYPSSRGVGRTGEVERGECSSDDRAVVADGAARR